MRDKERILNTMVADLIADGVSAARVRAMVEGAIMGAEAFLASRDGRRA